MKFEMYRERRKIWWRLRARNGKIVGRSFTGFSDPRDCIRSIEVVRKAVWTEAPIVDLTGSKTAKKRRDVADVRVKSPGGYGRRLDAPVEKKRKTADVKRRRR